MKEVYALDWTEYEFGSRPDGTSIHVDLATAKAFRDTKSSDGYDQFWRSNDPYTVMVSEMLYNTMMDSGGTTWATNSSWLKTTTQRFAT
jgi:hypothetical protein